MHTVTCSALSPQELVQRTFNALYFVYLCRRLSLTTATTTCPTTIRPTTTAPSTTRAVSHTQTKKTFGKLWASVVASSVDVQGRTPRICAHITASGCQIPGIAVELLSELGSGGSARHLSAYYFHIVFSSRERVAC